MWPNQTFPPQPAREASSPGLRSSGIVGPLELTPARARGPSSAFGRPPEMDEAARGPATRIRSNVLDDATRHGLIRGVTVRPIEAVRQEVEQRMLRGERFGDVEGAISSSGFSSDEKAALWLLGWSRVHPRAQRREANAHLTALAAAMPPRTMSSRRRVRIVR